MKNWKKYKQQLLETYAANKDKDGAYETFGLNEEVMHEKLNKEGKKLIMNESRMYEIVLHFIKVSDSFAEALLHTTLFIRFLKRKGLINS